MHHFLQKPTMPTAQTALPGRAEKMPVAKRHYILDTPLSPPFPAHYESALFGMGCFWGVERIFWQKAGVYSTHVGYVAGFTPNPTYEEVCTGMTGHNEVVRIIFDPAKLSYTDLLEVFWQGHDPTQYMRQGNDVGTQYRSGIYVYNDTQQACAEKTRALYQKALSAAGFGDIVTEIITAGEFYYAEDYHQQYLAKNPNGYCGIGGTGVCFT